jgi:phage/conjugal plasmid C-4 type zinc finger TraR family protein
MAGGWTRDGAVQEQIDDTVADALQEVRSQLHEGASREYCAECEEAIPEARRQAVPGVQLCLACQAARDQQRQHAVPFNRRGSKDSQLR